MTTAEKMEQRNAVIVKKLAKRAGRLAALLSVIGLLEPGHQNDSLAICASMAEELAQEVASLVEVTI